MDKKSPRLARMHLGAGYTLNGDVKHPTPSLLRASQIGVLAHDEPSLETQEARDAFLVASYGAARRASMEPLMDAIAAANPEADIFEAYTSRVMRMHARETEEIEIPSVEEALQVFQRHGYTRVAIASLHLFPGAEYMHLLDVFNEYCTKFRRMVLGTPLLYWMGQEEQRDDMADFTAALRKEIPPVEKDEAVLLIAHGTLHPSNSYYPLLQTRFEMADWDRAFVYTLAGWPRLEHIIPILKEEGIRRVTLVPLMLAVGSHATRDMAGDAPTSHRSRLIEAGFEVNVLSKGLGEMPSVQALYVERANEAWDKLREK